VVCFQVKIVVTGILETADFPGFRCKRLKIRRIPAIMSFRHGTPSKGIEPRQALRKHRQLLPGESGNGSGSTFGSRLG
jgi:hypothetical protein